MNQSIGPGNWSLGSVEPVENWSVGPVNQSIGPGTGLLSSHIIEKDGLQ